ncbi:hypothetical protein FDP25_14840 [Roseovarius sp. A21]|uniref:Uncharacterized protein n=1 Tax=Roseovarius bejariae TaxID=2576383 RepID=A0A844D057_9RHOB|nr:hypothetical protein [Roseovarius bejariae]MRU16716.1 hypothetical protein [Roseovarius bejariae]
MDILIWTGAFISLLGLVGLLWCIYKVWQARKSGLSDEALRDAVRKIVPLNTGALFVSVIGLMMVIVGIMLG